MRTRPHLKISPSCDVKTKCQWDECAHTNTHTHSIKLPNHSPYTTTRTSVTRNTTYLCTITFLKSAGTLAKIESFCRQTTNNTICLLLHHIHHLVAISHRRAHSTKHAVYQTLRWNRFLCSWGQFRNCQGIRNNIELFLLIHWHFQLMTFRITKTKNSEKLYPQCHIYIFQILSLWFYIFKLASGYFFNLIHLVLN